MAQYHDNKKTISMSDLRRIIVSGMKQWKKANPNVNLNEKMNGQSDAEIAMTLAQIAGLESSLAPAAGGDEDADGEWTSHGLFQVNDIHFQEEERDADDQVTQEAGMYAGQGLEQFLMPGNEIAQVEAALDIAVASGAGPYYPWSTHRLTTVDPVTGEVDPVASRFWPHSNGKLVPASDEKRAQTIADFKKYGDEWMGLDLWNKGDYPDYAPDGALSNQEPVTAAQPVGYQKPEAVYQGGIPESAPLPAAPPAPVGVSPVSTTTTFGPAVSDYGRVLNFDQFGNIVGNKINDDLSLVDLYGTNPDVAGDIQAMVMAKANMPKELYTTLRDSSLFDFVAGNIRISPPTPNGPIVYSTIPFNQDWKVQAYLLEDENSVNLGIANFVNNISPSGTIMPDGAYRPTMGTTPAVGIDAKTIEEHYQAIWTQWGSLLANEQWSLIRRSDGNFRLQSNLPGQEDIFYNIKSDGTEMTSQDLQAPQLLINPTTM